MGWLLVLFPEGIYCLLRWVQISVCIPSMDGSPATYWSYAAEALAFPAWEVSPTPIPPRWVRMSISSYPSSAVWRSQAGARCLGESCDTVLCSLNTFSCTTGCNPSTRKMKESVGLLKDTGDLVTEDMGKTQLLDALFALVHSQASWIPVAGSSVLVEWGYAHGRSRSQYELVLWTGMYKAMRPVGHLMLLREKARLTVGVLSVLFKDLWRSMTQRKIWETTSQSASRKIMDQFPSTHCQVYKEHNSETTCWYLPKVKRAWTTWLSFTLRWLAW